MSHKKLIRFEEVHRFENVLELPENMPGKWHQFFKNDHPITLELACGKGEYAVGLGRLYPERNFIGMDIKGNRLWRGAKTALEEGLKNVAFLRSRIEQLTDYFAAGEVAEIWLTFPDPQLRGAKIRKRLTHPQFLRRYRQLLSPQGIIHLKTDSPDLYHFTLQVIDLYGLELIEANDDVYHHQPVSPELSIKTYYEGLDIAGKNKVHHIAFRVDKPLPVEKDVLLKQLCGVQSQPQS